MQDNSIRAPSQRFMGNEFIQTKSALSTQRQQWCCASACNLQIPCQALFLFSLLGLAEVKVIDSGPIPAMAALQMLLISSALLP